MSLKTTFDQLAAMAGIKAPQAGARFLRDALERLPDGPVRVQGQAEMAKWFLYFRGSQTPRSIGSYMMAVEAVLHEDMAPRS